MSNLTMKTLGVAIFCATLAACGGGDDPVVDSDPGTGGGGTGGGESGGGGTGGGAGGGTGGEGGGTGGEGGGTGGEGGGTGGGEGGGTGGEEGGGREGNGPDLPDGTPLAATAGAAMSAEFPCKIEVFDGTALVSETAVNRTLSFDPATLTLSVDGTAILDGTVAGSTWGYINQSSEYESASTETTAGATDEVAAKIFHTGAPAYLRSKMTAADFSYEQLECYQGLIVQ